LAAVRRTGLALAGLRYASGSFRVDGDGSDDASGADVYGELCAFDPALDESDPAARPTAATRMATSEHFREHRRMLPLAEVIAAARGRDVEAGAVALSVDTLHFHEGQAGAGLVVSALAAVGPAPARVVAEHPSLRNALAACDVIRHRNRSDDCDAVTQGRIVADPGEQRRGDAPLPRYP